MEEFNASLVREKIVLVDDGMDGNGDSGGGPAPTVIRSNRIFLRLGQRAATENIVIRAQNMHTTLRLAGKIAYDYFKQGAFIGRAVDWNAAWESVLSNYEKEFNPDIWGAVYINGKAMFKTTTSPFVDVIEKCALLTIDNYDATMGVTESALKQIGRAMRISHSSNVASVFGDNGDMMRCGVIHRAQGRDTTFSFTAAGGVMDNRIAQSFSVVAAFLEAINMQFHVKMLQDKARRGELPKTGREPNQLRLGTTRLVGLDKGIASFEDIYEVKYRPERPQFFGL
jgi:hypothetical protein